MVVERSVWSGRQYFGLSSPIDTGTWRRVLHHHSAVTVHRCTCQGALVITSVGHSLPVGGHRRPPASLLGDCKCEHAVSPER